MVVDAPLVVGGEQLGAFVVEDRGQAGRRLVDVGGPKGAGRVIRGGPGHPRVVVAEELDPADAEDLGRPFGLPGALGRQLGARREVAGSGRAELSSGRDHQHHPMAGVGGLGDDAPGGDRLVVRMRVEGHQGLGHAASSHAWSGRDAGT